MSRELSAGYSEGKTGEQAMEVTMHEAWAGVDAGKEFHWAHLLWALRAQRAPLPEGPKRRGRHLEAHRRRSLVGRGGPLGHRSAWRWRGALAGPFVGTRSENPLLPRSQRGSCPPDLSRGVQNRCP